MFALLYSILLLWTISPALASPIPDLNLDCSPARGLFCKASCECSRQESTSQSVDTILGTAKGVQDNGATRFSVKYASAQRWEPSSIQSTWELPNGSNDPSALPLACPQSNLSNSSMSEDCLSIVLYVPNSSGNNENVPTLMWIHGGSYVAGSASGPGLDGSNLAVATGSIVAVIQYRLGALGLMAPNGQSNLAVKDVIVALQFLKLVVPSFGGSAKKITISGQSSGADMVRALLATNSASPLFQSAIIQSDPMDYGFLSTTTHQILQDYFNGVIGCTSTDTQCLASLSLDKIINATNDLYGQAPSLDPSVGTGQPIRPVRDNSLIVHTMDSTSPFPRVSKPVLLSTVLNEAGLSIYGAFGTPLSSSIFDQLVGATFGDPRTGILLKSQFYNIPVTTNGTTDARVQLEQMGTDYLWKCSTWSFARSWVASGGTAYVGLYTVGATYPGNEAVPFCTGSGAVCHQDDIEIVFGTVTNPNTAQSNLIKEMQARYKAFLQHGNPNTSGVPNWPAATSNNPNAILLGSSGMAPVGACVSTFWGQAVPYDYQVYNI